MNYATDKAISDAAKATFNEFNESAIDIHSGDCPEFAKSLYNKLIGIDAVIKTTESFELIDRLEGYPTEVSEYGTRLSHCYVEVEGYGYDALNLDGEEEDLMEYIENTEIL